MKKCKKKVRVLWSLILIMGLCSCSWRKNPVKEVHCIEFEITSYKNIAGYEGVVEAKNVKSITVDKGVVIEKFYVKEGHRVKKGDKLFKIDTVEEEKKLKEQKKILQDRKKKWQKKIEKYTEKITKFKNDSKIKEKKQEKEIKKAKKEYLKQKKAYQRLKNENINVTEKYQQYVVMSTSEERYLALQENIEKLKEQNDFQLELLEEELEKYKETNDYLTCKKQMKVLRKKINNAIRTSDMEGIVTKICVQEYGIVSDGKVMGISNEEEKRVIFSVPAEDFDSISEGQQVQVYSKCKEQICFNGSITSKGWIVNDGSIEVIANIEKAQQLLMGESVNVEIIMEKVDNLIVLKKENIYYDENGEKYIYVVRENDEIYKKYINPLYEDEKSFYVERDTFYEDDLLVTDNIEDMVDKDRVKVIKR